MDEGKENKFAHKRTPKQKKEVYIFANIYIGDNLRPDIYSIIFLNYFELNFSYFLSWSRNCELWDFGSKISLITLLLT